MERFFMVDIRYACYGIIAVDNVVTEAAPIAKWMIGKRLADIKPFLIKHKAKVTEIVT